MPSLKIKKWYLTFIDKDERNLSEKIFYYCLCQLSAVYAACVRIRNFLYENKVFTIHKASQKVISIGGLSWAGTGKTTLSLYLYRTLKAAGQRACIVRRGYGEDETKMLRAATSDVFVAVDRVQLLKEHSRGFDVAILDDGFQYRKLYRDIDIVMMTAREWAKKIRLIPASSFREPLNSLERANILLITYSSDSAQRVTIENSVKEMFPNLSVFFARYNVLRFVDTHNKTYAASYFKNRNVAALAGIGYPQGFFTMLKDVGVTATRTITYPDHYALSTHEFDDLQQDLLKSGTQDLVITKKDLYHLPLESLSVNLIVMEIDIQIDDEKRFLKIVTDALPTIAR